jgi:hypothetical protein
VAANLEQTDRDADRFVGTYSAISDKEGRFLIANVLPEEEMTVVGAGEDLGGRGYVRAQALKTGQDGVVVDVGDLEVVPGRTLSGRVVLSDGNGVPAHTRLTVGREGVSDPRTVELKGDGSFTVVGLPEEAVTVSVRVPGYAFSKRNASLVPLFESSLLGRVEGDRRLVVLLEPEPARPQGFRMDAETAAMLRKAREKLRLEPLAGVEAGRTE